MAIEVGRSHRVEPGSRIGDVHAVRVVAMAAAAAYALGSKPPPLVLATNVLRPHAALTRPAPDRQIWRVSLVALLAIASALDRRLWARG